MSTQTQTHWTLSHLVDLRSAVLSIIDAGCTCLDETHPWEFYEDPDQDNPDAFTEDGANQNRLRFADAVQAYIVERSQSKAA